jgi:hypothetical protein
MPRLTTRRPRTRLKRSNGSNVRAHCEAGVKQLLALRNRFIARNVQVLVDEVSADCKSGPVLIPQVH